jgi:transaldolase/glucose-6-phosphate isomerase
MSADSPHQILNIGDLQNFVDERLKSWEEIDFNRRLFEKDPTLWFSEPTTDIADRLGWLTLPESMQEQTETLVPFAKEVKNDGMRYIVLLGMGGSSLAARVFQSLFGNAPDYPELIVLDSTHPNAVQAVEEKIDLRHSLFIVASKSGTTLEPLAFFMHFWKKVEETVDHPGRRFIAITDPGTPLVQLAKEKGFRRIFLAPPDLGGRYSALTVFGLVPAVLIGVDIQRLLGQAQVAAKGSAIGVSEHDTPGLVLAATLGELAIKGKNKVTFLAPPSLESFPNWLEQLIAESTGKDSKGIIPVVNEPSVEPSTYGNDRLFVYFSVTGDENQDLEKKVKELEALGHPVVHINLNDEYDIGLEIFRWEVAVASAGAVLGIHPFNQPDVESAKVLALEAMEKKRSDAKDGVETISVEDQNGLSNAFDDWLAQGKEGDYIALQAFLAPDEKTTKLLQKIQTELLERMGLATTFGYGPRFLHSTGQLHKGGPNNGLFLQIVDTASEDLPVPGADYTFGEIIGAQAIGDYLALKERGRRVLRVDLKKDVAGWLSRISKLLSAKQETERV